jgi:tripartite-type tricarboxylate transporter receptor subunit TctC
MSRVSPQELPVRNRVAALLFAFFPALAFAQAFPAKPILLVVPFSPGAANDFLARTLAAEAKDGLGAIVVENKPGANGNIGAEFVRRAPADGHTLLIAPNAFVILAAMPPQPFDFAKDFSPVVLATALPFYLVVNQEALPARNVRELIEFAKARPGKLSYASAGNGSPHQLAMELLKLQTGIDVTHVPYKGMGQGVVDLLAGRTQMTITGFPSVAGHMKGGKLRVLATAGSRRSPLQPDVPTIAETGVPGYEMDSWLGILAPAGTPRPVIDKINGELNRALALPQVKEKLAAQGLDVLGGTPQQFAGVIRADYERYVRVVKASNIKPD